MERGEWREGIGERGIERVGGSEERRRERVLDRGNGERGLKEGMKRGRCREGGDRKKGGGMEVEGNGEWR